ncbi:MAG: glycolate oxidase subunit GlcF [Gammaproteobacteria bacterium]
MRAPVSAAMAAEDFSAEAAAIVRSCVHCGFCNATCPTYQLTGDELEGPRGRIYLVKALLEDGRIGAETRLHLDHCLVCRNCETTCPSGVRYGRLVELVRPRVLRRAPPPWPSRLLRRALLTVVPYPRRFAPLVAAARLLRPLLPARLAAHLPPRPASYVPPPVTDGHTRRVLLLGGCAQPVLNPAIDAAAARVFDALGIELVKVRGADCCGALAHHLGAEDVARAQARRVVDAWWPAVAAGADAVMVTASGCGVQLKDYAQLLQDDAEYAERAARIAGLARDPLELVDAGLLAGMLNVTGVGPLAVQTPCSLQHGQRLGGRLESLLRACGFELVPVAESHLCCGSAGSYALVHVDKSSALRTRKLDNLMAARPHLIVTANIGCQTHLAQAAQVPVRHWLEVVAECLPGT